MNIVKKFYGKRRVSGKYWNCWKYENDRGKERDREDRWNVRYTDGTVSRNENRERGKERERKGDRDKKGKKRGSCEAPRRGPHNWCCTLRWLCSVAVGRERRNSSGHGVTESRVSGQRKSSGSSRRREKEVEVEERGGRYVRDAWISPGWGGATAIPNSRSSKVHAERARKHSRELHYRYRVGLKTVPRQSATAADRKKPF